MLNNRQIFDLERACKGSVPSKLFEAMLSFNNDIHALRQQIMQLAAMFSQLADNQIIQANATQVLREQTPYLKNLKQQGMEVSTDPSITGEADED